MRFNTIVSRRGALALAGILGISLLAGAPVGAAKKKAPDITGEWTGVLNATGFPPTNYTLSITEQKKNGKFSGEAEFEAGGGPVSLSGKIQPNRKVKGSFSGDINGEPIVFSIKVTVSRDAQSAEGTFKGKDEDGNVVVSGTTTLERVPAEE